MASIFFLLLVGLSIQNPLFIYVGLIIYFGISYDHLLPVVRLCSTPRLPYVHTFKNSRNKQKRPFLYFRRWTNRIHSMGTNYPYTLYLDRHYLPLIKLYFFILPYNSFKSNDDLEYFLKIFSLSTFRIKIIVYLSTIFQT